MRNPDLWHRDRSVPNRWSAGWFVWLARGIAALAAAGVATAGWTASSTPPTDTRDRAACPVPESVEVVRDGTDRIRFKSRLPVASLSSGFGLQYWGNRYTPQELAAAPHGMLVVEAARASGVNSPDGRELWFSVADVLQMRRGGERPVLAYLNVSEVETYRDYWLGSARQGDGSPQWYAGDTGEGDQLAAYWTPEWREILVARLERILDLGFDGVLLDDVLQYYTWAAGNVRRRATDTVAGTPADAPGFARAMIALVRELRARADARHCGAVIIVNNGVFIGRDAGPDEGADPSATFKAYREAIDGILVESVIAVTTQEVAVRALEEDYLQSGLPVLDIEFLSVLPNLSPADFTAMVSARANQLGFIPYIARDHLFDRLEPPAATKLTYR